MIKINIFAQTKVNSFKNKNTIANIYEVQINLEST